MSNLSELLPAGAGAKSADFVASGTLGSGVTVALNSNGTVSTIVETAIPSSVGAETVAYSNSETNITATYHPPSGKIVVAFYNNNTTYLSALVGTVSGSSISFGTLVTTSNPGGAESAVYDPTSEKIVLCVTYYSYRRITTISVSGNLPVFSGVYSDYEGQGLSSNTGKAALSYDPTNGVVVVAYENRYDRIAVRTFQTDTLTFGDNYLPYGTSTSAQYGFDINYLPDIDRHVVVYDTNSTSAYYFNILTVSASTGANIAFTSSAVFQSGIYASRNFSMAFDETSNYLVCSIQGAASSYNGLARGYKFNTSGIISSTNLTAYLSTEMSYTNVVYSAASKKCLIGYIDESLNPNQRMTGVLVESLADNTNVTFSSPFGIGSPNKFEINLSKDWLTYDSVNQRVIGAYNSRVFQATSLDSYVITTAYNQTNVADFVGITDQAIADTATGAVIVQGGVSEKLSGLTVGADYYVQADGSISSPTGAYPYNLSGAVFIDSFSVSAQETLPMGVAFSADGTKMFIIGESGGDVTEYTLSVGFDVSTASFVDRFVVSGQDNAPLGLAFNADGTTMFIIGDSSNTVYQYTLSVGFDVSTASYASKSFNVSSQETNPTGIAFNTTGTKMFIVGINGDSVYEYSLSIGFDVSTASYVTSFSVAAQETSPQDVAFNTDGTKMFVVGNTGQDINEYALSTGFDVSTAVFVDSFSVSAQETLPNGIAFNTNGTKMFVVGQTGDDVNEYTLNGSTSSVPAGRALSTTSILLEG